MASFTKAQKEQYKQQKQTEQQELLARAIDNLMSSDGFRRYLDSRARFHRYSFTNTILIALQRPDATMVTGKGGKKGTSGWKALGRTVKEGERSIKILAPNFVYAKDDSGKVLKDDNGKSVIRFVWFKVVDVFDYEQTEGDPLPEPPKEYGIAGNTHEEYLLRLKRLAKGMGRAFAVNAKQPINAQVHDLTAMIVESLMRDLDNDYTLAERAVMREAATYLACRHMGLDTSGVSVPSLAKLNALASDDPKERVNLVKTFAEHIDTLADTIKEGVLL